MFGRFVVSSIEVKEVQARHFEEYGAKPCLTVRVPGITRFLGPFADYSLGHSFCAADNRVLYLCLSVAEENQIRFFNTAANDRKHFNSSALKYRKEDRWANYIKGVLLELMTEGARLPGLNITVGGDLLSANNDILCCSIVVAMCLAMQKLLNLHFERDVLGRMIVKGCVNFGGEVCCASMVATMICAKPGNFVYFDNNATKAELVGNFFEGSASELLYIETGLPNAVMREEVSRMHREIKALYEKQFGELGIVNLAGRADSDIREKLAAMPEDEKRIIQYLIEEYRTAILPSFTESAFAKALGRTGKAMNNILEFSFPEMDWILKRANESAGCLGVSAVATGGNGTVGAVMNRDSVDSFKAKLEDYERIFGFKLKMYEFVPQGGAVVFGNTDENTSDK